MAVGEPEAEVCVGRSVREGVQSQCPCARLAFSVLVLKAALTNSDCLCADIAVLSACPLEKFYKPSGNMESMKVCKIL